MMDFTLLRRMVLKLMVGILDKLDDTRLQDLELIRK